MRNTYEEAVLLEQGGVLDRIVFRGGDRVRLRIGAVVYSNNPNHPATGKIMNARRVVTLQKVGIDGERTDAEVHEGMPDATVWWTGLGGYWCWTWAGNIDRVDQ